MTRGLTLDKPRYFRLYPFIRRWVSPGVRNFLNYILGYAIYYDGEFSTWATACTAAKGYCNPKLLKRLTDAALAVQSGQAVWEQDGFVFDHIPFDTTVLAAFARVALANEGRLAVLDFGGGFGSIFFQCREFLSEVQSLNWAIVEQPEIVDAGRELLSRDNLHFFNTVDEAMLGQCPNVILLSSVLQYLESPWTLLDSLIATDIPYIIIDRHPCTYTRELITVQVIPPRLYPASYPTWLFDGRTLLEKLEPHYRLLADWNAKDPPIRGWGKGAEFRGYLFQKRCTA